MRERKTDIPDLANFFLKRFATKYNKQELMFSGNALKALTDYSWPGNVRELQHTIEKAVILSDKPTLEVTDFNMKAIDSKEVVLESMTIEEMEKILIEKSMKKNDNNISAVAQELGITRPTLYSKLNKYGL